MLPDYKQLHELEEQLIQIVGLMKALQILLPDGDSHTCVANKFEESILDFEKYFYKFWRNSLKIDSPSSNNIMRANPTNL